MKLNEFVNKLHTQKGNYGTVVSVSSHSGKQIVENAAGEYYVDGFVVEAELESLEEVKRYIDLQELASKTKSSLYEDISDKKIARIIKKYNEDIRVTTTLVELYMTLASSKTFTLDPVLLEMRTSYKTGNLIESKIDFKLQDGTKVAVSEDTLKRIGNLLNSTDDNEEIIEYMRQSFDNFMYVVRQL